MPVVSEPTQILITALVGTTLTAAALAVLLALALAALWRTRRQRDAAREQARYHADRAEHLIAELDAITERTRPVAAALLGQEAPVIPGCDADPEQAIEAALVCLTEADLLERNNIDGSAALTRQAHDKLRQLTSEQLVQALALALGAEALERADMVEQVPADAAALLDGGDR